MQEKSRLYELWLNSLCAIRCILTRVTDLQLYFVPNRNFGLLKVAEACKFEAN
jgi:hypothetical protein